MRKAEISGDIRLPESPPRSEAAAPLPSERPWRVGVADGVWARGRIRHLVAEHADIVTVVPVPKGDHHRGDSEPPSGSVAVDLLIVELSGEPADIESLSAMLPRRPGPPVLVVKRAPEQPYRHVIVGTDLGPSSAELSGLAAQVAPGARHVVIHAVPGTAAYEPAGRQTTGAGPIVRIGQPEDVLANAARETHPDLVVLGASPGRTLRRMAAGSVIEPVLREVPCDVLLVPAGDRRRDEVR